MKTGITMLLVLLLALVCTAASAQEYYTLPEIREQAAQGWHESVTDRYGRETTVDVDVQVFGEEYAPVVSIRPSELVIDSERLEAGAVHTDRTIYKNNPADDVFGARGGQVTMTVHHTYGERIDVDAVYGGAYGAPLTMRQLSERAGEVMAAQGISLEGFLYDQPKEFSIRCKLQKATQEVVAPAAYLAHFWQTMHGMPILESICRTYERPAWPEFAPQLQVTMRGSDEYAISLWAAEETELLAQDIPLCAWETIRQSIRKEIESGHVQKLYSVRLGYVVYNAATYPEGMRSIFDADSYFLVPTWVVECIWMDNPKQTWRYAGWANDELCDNEKSGAGYHLMMVNAQTGEVFDRNDRSAKGRGDAVYKGFIPWDGVQQ